VPWTRCWAIETVDGNCPDDYAIKPVESKKLSDIPGIKISSIINLLIKVGN
jgi:hypothetical protein